MTTDERAVTALTSLIVACHAFIGDMRAIALEMEGDDAREARDLVRSVEAARSEACAMRDKLDPLPF